ncbi:hypothetical protein PR202_ga24933 [Eleusine coracana subsp. coracana]|uniref:DUF7866 domain-containing protein n=1 Tax=Eleusine coracana subsp. coracana TaxID=191504 RepID=A0AAV5DA55_ELECO|nr:hypothetical protein QOZ80_9AG0672820 [Eleusine coracana subsp. coracana]GJN07131.1 hypothetical protein PR202_ga24933 [Eleusine coracana subsp. coracana]
MICLALLLAAALHAQGASNKQVHLLASGNQKQGISRRSSSPSIASEEEEEFVPVQTVVYRSLAAGEPFRTCGECRCCSKSNNSNCFQTRCCYGINCNLPGKPFGNCSFTPRTCGCGPSNCTNPPSASSLNSSTKIVV